MNILLKSAVAGALALSATGAFALGQPGLGSSDLVLIVENETTNATYALDTGISINSVLPTGSLVSGATLNTSISINAAPILESTTLATFLAANPASGDGWTLEAGQYAGGSATAASTNGNSKKAGNAVAIFTSGSNSANMSASGLSTLENFENGLAGDINSQGGLAPLVAGATETTAATYAGQALSKYGFANPNDLGSLGSSAIALYGFTGNGSTTSPLQSYILGSASLSSGGVLTFTGNGTTTAPVPLPAAIWLLGSGLLGLVGVSRRNKAAV
jgi:hypothetical protein